MPRPPPLMSVTGVGKPRPFPWAQPPPSVMPDQGFGGEEEGFGFDEGIVDGGSQHQFEEEAYDEGEYGEEEWAEDFLSSETAVPQLLQLLSLAAQRSRGRGNIRGLGRGRGPSRGAPSIRGLGHGRGPSRGAPNMRGNPSGRSRGIGNRLGFAGENNFEGSTRGNLTGFGRGGSFEGRSRGIGNRLGFAGENSFEGSTRCNQTGFGRGGSVEGRGRGRAGATHGQRGRGVRGHAGRGMTGHKGRGRGGLDGRMGGMMHAPW